MLPQNIFRLLVYFAVAVLQMLIQARVKQRSLARLSAKIFEKIQMALGPVVPMRKSAAIHFPTSLLKVNEWPLGELILQPYWIASAVIDRAIWSNLRRRPTSTSIPRLQLSVHH
jgi:hypothetical protein